MARPEKDTIPVMIRITPQAKAALTNLAAHLGYLHDGAGSLSGLINAVGQSLGGGVDKDKR